MTPVAQRTIDDLDAYRRSLRARLNPTVSVLSLAYEAARSNPKRVLFTEGEEPNVLRAAIAVREAGYGTPVLVGREETYEAGKDTGRYWDSGASNVHWLIATDSQIEKGMREALARVKSPGVFVEGNSFSQFVNTDYFVMVRRPGDDKIKTSARRALNNANTIYVSESDLSSLIEDIRSALIRVNKHGIA